MIWLFLGITSLGSAAVITTSWAFYGSGMIQSSTGFQHPTFLNDYPNAGGWDSLISKFYTSNGYYYGITETGHHYRFTSVDDLSWKRNGVDLGVSVDGWDNDHATYFANADGVNSWGLNASGFYESASDFQTPDYIAYVANTGGWAVTDDFYTDHGFYYAVTSSADHIRFNSVADLAANSNGTNLGPSIYSGYDNKPSYFGASTVPVPEPGGALLLCLVGTVHTFRRRRRDLFIRAVAPTLSS